MFSLLFFLLTSFFAAAQSPHDMAILSLEGPPGPTTDCNGNDVWRGRKDHRVLALVCATSLCPSQLHAVAFTSARSMSPCPSLLHAPRRRAPFAGLPLVRFLFFLFSANFSFCGPIAVLSLPSLPMDERLSSPSRAYHGATTNHDDNGTMAMMCVQPRGCDNVTMMITATAPCGTMTATTSTQHGTTTVTMTPHVA